MSSILPEVDKQAMLNNAELGQSIVDGFQEALKHGVDGWCDDDLEFTKPWGFELAEIKVPVFLYQGSEDLMVPYSHGQWLAEHLPQGKLRKHLVQGDGHISIFLGHVDAMMDELLEVVRAQ
jgi:pimeloyl-ACP methyl ester carboxylesterase